MSATFASMRAKLEAAYARGDHRLARAIAHAILAAPNDPADAERARTILAYTTPDRFLSWVGTVGLGLTAWLVYNYVS